MAYFFSPSSGGFYRTDIHTSIPSDAVEVSDELHATLLAGQAEGKIIAMGTTGPEVRDLPKPAPDEVMAMLRNQRNALLSTSDWTQMPDAPDAKRAQWATYRQALRDLPEAVATSIAGGASIDSVQFPEQP